MYNKVLKRNLFAVAYLEKVVKSVEDVGLVVVPSERVVLGALHLAVV